MSVFDIRIQISISGTDDKVQREPFGKTRSDSRSDTSKNLLGKVKTKMVVKIGRETSFYRDIINVQLEVVLVVS